MKQAARPGYTLMESLAALGILATAAVIAAQVGTWSLIERGRTQCRLAATDAAANLLEAARAVPWNDLTPEWATGQRLPAFVADRLHDATLAVVVAPERDQPKLKRVTVDIRWDHRPTAPPEAVKLTALFADRSAGGGP
jgi:prepilin-type N-terminal cleavage/methylation domain-containing protein